MPKNPPRFFLISFSSRIHGTDISNGVGGCDGLNGEPRPRPPQPAQSGVK